MSKTWFAPSAANTRDFFLVLNLVAGIALTLIDSKPSNALSVADRQPARCRQP
jgi:hypothetical protein